jgi:hypothetical protein
MMNESKQGQTFSGVLMPYQNDNPGRRAPTMCLVDPQAGEVLVDDRMLDGDLREYIYERVIIHGSMKKYNGVQVLTVDRFETLADPDYDDPIWDDEDY